jgi:DNA-binding response OmpR family regulator
MPERLEGFRILVLEDEYFIGADLENALRAAGADVIGPLALGEEARALIAARVCHAAILDIKLADEDGYAAADELAQRQIPFVFATGYSAEFIPHRFRSVLRWEKPYNIDEAVNDLVRLLRAPRAR